MPEYDASKIDAFRDSSCLQTTEDDHFVTFRGPLDGNQNCQIYQTVEFDGVSLYDVYEFVIGYDDLYDYLDNRLVQTSKFASRVEILDALRTERERTSTSSVKSSEPG